MADFNEAQQEPGPPFSAAVLQLYHQAQNARSKRAQIRALQALAAQLAKEHNPGDCEYSDEYHDMFADYEHARLEFRIQSMKLGRLAMHMITEYNEATSNLLATKTFTKTKGAN